MHGIKKIVATAIVAIVSALGYNAYQNFAVAEHLDTSEMELYYEADFEGFGAGGLETHDPQCVSTSSGQASSGSQSLSLEPSEADYGFLVLRKELEWRNSYVIEYDVFVRENPPSTGKKFRNRVSASVYGVFHTSENHLISFKEDGRILSCGSKFGKWEPGKWHHVRIRLDADREDKSFSTWIDVDGARTYHRGLPLPDKGRSLGKLGKSPELWFSLMHLPCYIDNVKVYASSA